MRIGMLARSDDRGLGTLLREFYAHVQPERVLIVHPQHHKPIPFHDERYGPDAIVTTWQNQSTQRFDLPEREIRQWLDGLDVVYTAETMYDWRIVDWARMQGVRTVCHVMPEYFRHFRPKAPSPADMWWNPTSWLHERVLPPEARIVPVPVAIEHWPTWSTEVHDPIRWLHTGGVVAAMDRNGMQCVRRLPPELHEQHHITIRAQGEPIDPVASTDNVEVVLDSQAVDDYWDLYDGFDALVLPRRYGGLSLPAQEAMGAGLGLLMPDMEPQCSTWPIIDFPAIPGTNLPTVIGFLRVNNILPVHVAEVMDRIARDPSELITAKKQARAWAEANSWDQLLPTIMEEFARVIAL